jgi:hypothetical protein
MSEFISGVVVGFIAFVLCLFALGKVSQNTAKDACRETTGKECTLKWVVDNGV